MNAPLTTAKEQLKSEILSQISSSHFVAPGSSGQKGVLYHEIFFDEFQGAGPRRAESGERLAAILAHCAPAGKSVLDIGCNVGYFSFGLAVKGARVVGIDHDQDSIRLANRLKDYYSVDNVSFESVGFSRETASDLVKRHGSPDIILLNSVIHWLFYACDDLQGVINALRPLLADDKAQTIIYEPSSSDVAYYPELLSARGVREFFNNLGIFNYSELGQFWVSNTAQRRQYFLGLRNVEVLKRESLRSLEKLEQDQLRVGDDAQALGQIRSISRRKSKLIIVSDSFVLKSHDLRSKAAGLLIQNESEMISRFNSRFKPNLIWSGDIGGRQVLIYARTHGQSLNQLVVGRADSKVISHYLIQLLSDLEHSGITHNDLRPDNLIWNSRTKSLTVIDFEYAQLIGQDMSALLVSLQEASDQNYLKAQLAELGGWCRSPAGPFTTENDRYAAKSISYLLANRRRYYLKKIFEVTGLAKINRNIKRRLGTTQ